MTTKKISELAAAAALSGSEVVPVVQAGADVKTTLSDILKPAVHAAGNQTITGIKTFSSSPVVPTPTASAQAANRGYVDTAVSGGSSGARLPVKVISLTNQNVALVALPGPIDGYQPVDGDRVLLVAQTTASQNGIWTVSSLVGWVRPVDFATGTNQAGSAVFVAGGTLYAGSSWVLASTGTINVGSHAQTWIGSKSPDGAVAFGNIRVRGEMGVNPMHPDFGAVGDGVTDDILALERARDFCLTGSLTASPSDPATTIRTAMYPLMVTKTHKVSRPFKLYSLSDFKMVGNGRNTGFLGTAGQTNALDINGCTWSTFKDFSANGPASSGNVDAVIDYYWDNRTAMRSTSGCTFENIQIGGRFIHGFGVSRLGFLISGGAPQVDQTKFDQVLITGGSSTDATLWQRAWSLGNGVAGNQTNYWFIGGGVALCKYGWHGSGVKDILILGGAAALIDTLVYNNGLWDFTCMGMELEDVAVLYDAVGVTSSPNRVTFENIEHAFITVPSDGKFVKHYQGGTFTLRGYRQANFPAGTHPSLAMTFFQTGANEMNVILDGLQMFEPLDAIMNWSGPVRAQVTGYSQLSKSTFAVTSNIAGPLYITPNAADIAHRVRQTADTVDRWNVDATGAMGFGPGGSTAQDTTLARVSGGGLALGGGGLRLNGHSTLHSVTGVPGSGVGANGDLAVRDDGTAGATIYHKRAGAWVAIA